MLLERLKKLSVSGPTLERPYPSKRFYINTYWSKDGTVSVILQVYVSEEEIKSEAQKKAGIKWEFDNSLEVMGLRPISFISRSTVLPLGKSRHVFVGESTSVRWVIGKFNKYLWGS